MLSGIAKFFQIVILVRQLSENVNLQNEQDKNIATLKGCNKIYQDKVTELENVKKAKTVIEEKLSCICQERDRLLNDQRLYEDIKKSKECLRKELDDTKVKYNKAVDELQQLVKKK